MWSQGALLTVTTGSPSLTFHTHKKVQYLHRSRILQRVISISIDLTFNTHTTNTYTTNTHTTISKMDLGIQFTKGEEQAMQAEARKELEEEGQLEKLAAETAAAVDAKVEVEAQVAALEDAGLEVGAKSISEDGIIDDEGYVSGEEDDGAKAVAVTGGGDLIAGSSILDPVDSLDFLDAVAVTDGSITPGSSDQGFNDSYPPTPLDSPLGLNEELDEGFVEGVSAAETNITPEGSINEIQNTFESDGSLDGSLPFDDGLSANERDEQQRKSNRKLVKLKLKELDARDAQEMREAKGGAGSAENEGRGFAL